MKMGSSRRVPVNRSSTAYDAVGCLACGFFILAACEAAYDGRWLFERSWSPAAIGLCGMIALCLGRIVSAASRLVVDDWFVGGVVSRPEENLLGREKRFQYDWKQIVFRSYYKPLPRSRELIVPAASREGRAPAMQIFRRALAVISDDRAAAHRCDRLLQFCSFYRTMCVGLLAVSVILVSGIVWHSLFSSWGQAESRKLGYALLALLESVGMLYRYLKFRRQHAAAVLVGSAELRIEQPPSISILPNR
jgi:hypothetical protein